MTHQATFIKKQKLTDDVYLFSFKLGSAFEYIPGQFFIFELTDRGGTFMRSYSIYSYDKKSGIVEFIIKLVKGRGTTVLDHVAEKTVITFRGPVGQLTLKSPVNNIVFIGTGTGISPLMSMITNVIDSHQNTNIFFLNGQRSEEDLFLTGEIEYWMKMNLVHVYTTLSRPSKHWVGFTGRVTDHLSKIPTSEVDVYICGNDAMVTSVKELLIKQGVDPAHIYSEKFFK